MADIQVPSIATATPAAADTVVGVQGGAVKRMAVGNLAKVGSFTQAGTGAVARTVESKLRDVVSVKDFGATGDGVTDDSATIQAALDAVAGTDTTLHFPNGTYRSSTALTAIGVRRIRMDGEIYFYNSSDGLTIGRTSSITADMARCDLRIRVRGPVDTAGITGVICRGITRSEVTAHVDGFEYGFEHRMTSGEYTAGCVFNLTLRNCRVKLRFDSSATAFCSDNRYPGLVAVKQDETLTPTIGVEWADNTAPSTNNIFEKAWLENNDTPIKFAGECANNKFFNARLEGAGAIVFTTGGTNGGASGNMVTSDMVSDELSFWSEYTSDSPFPNFVDSGIFAGERASINEVSWRDWSHRTGTAGRNWMCPKLVSAAASGFSFGPDYFDWATVDDAERSFTITNNDEGYFDVPVATGDQFLLGVHHNASSVSANATVVRLEGLDASKAPLGDLGAGSLPYIGTTRHSSAGHTGTSYSVNIQNDRARLSTGIRINRDEVKWMRVVLRPSVEFYKVNLQALHDRYSRPRPPKLPESLPFKYIDSLSEAPDFNGQIGKVRGVEHTVIGIEKKWRSIGFKKDRVSLVAGVAVVNLGHTMPSTAYHVLVSGYANETFWVSNKTATTFQINSSNGSSTAQVEYIVHAP